MLLRDLQLDSRTLTDHIPDVISEIIRDLALGRDGPISAEHLHGSPPVHGVQRFHDGLEIGEVVAEYSLLRGAFETVAEKHGLFFAGEAARIINRRIDEAIRMAIEAFAAHQALIRMAQHDEHLAFITHDLRTPLNAVSLIVEELRDGMAVEAADLLFEMLGRNLLRLEGLIGKVLEASTRTLPAGSSFVPERRHFELWPLVQRLILDFRAISLRKHIEVLNEVPGNLSVFADAGLLSQVFQNLLGNAFKYSAHGRVVVHAAEESGVVSCVVGDNGTGISPEMLARIFDRLVTDPEKPGTGLGLAIVKQIVEAHGGRVEARSTPGSGASIFFTIPGPSN